MQTWLNAGYTHVIQYQVWLAHYDAWADSRFPTTPDTVNFYRKTMADREARGLIRNIKITEISELL